MSKFKTGNKVRVKKDLESGVEYGNVTFLEVLKNLRGKEVTIEGYTLAGRIGVHESAFLFSKEMLEPVLSLNEQLKEFALVKFRTGEHAILIEGAMYTKEELMNCDGFTIELSDFNSDLKDVYDIDNNIVAFSNFANKHDAITTLLQGKSVVWDWQRQEKKKMTQSEIEEELGYKIEIVEEKKNGKC
jgi:hypothetical protein